MNRLIAAIRSSNNAGTPLRSHLCSRSSLEHALFELATLNHSLMATLRLLIGFIIVNRSSSYSCRAGRARRGHGRRSNRNAWLHGSSQIISLPVILIVKTFYTGQCFVIGVALLKMYFLSRLKRPARTGSPNQGVLSWPIPLQQPPH